MRQSAPHQPAGHPSTIAVSRPPARSFRTLLEQKIRERHLTFEEFTEYAEAFAREHGEVGTLSLRHLQRLMSGHGQNGRPLGPVRPATGRLLEHIFGLTIDELLGPPAAEPISRRSRLREVEQLGAERTSEQDRPAAESDEGAGLDASLDWLDQRAGWIADTSRRKVTSRLARSGAQEVRNRHGRGTKVGRRELARTLREYYRAGPDGYGFYQVHSAGERITTSIVTRPDWLDVACPLTPEAERLTLATGAPTRDEIDTRQAVRRLAEAAALNVRVANVPLYRLLDVHIGRGAITGTVGLVPFAEYALTMDLLEGELVDAIASGAATRPGDLPLRDRYLPDLASVLNLGGRVCAGGTLALCAIARPADPYRGAPDYALLVQERSAHVLNAARRLSVIPKGFHQPLKDVRADARIGATLRREMEEELFGRGEVDSTVGDWRVAAPMHPDRLSEPMRWLTDNPDIFRMECTGFGLNLVSGNYEFASLVVIDDEHFWSRYGGKIEANWESSGLRVYSSLDEELLVDLISEDIWSNEGLFALLQGLRRLRELNDSRVKLPRLDLDLADYSR